MCIVRHKQHLHLDYLVSLDLFVEHVLLREQETRLSVVESPTTSRSILLKKQELQQDIFETKQNWDRKVKNREYSKAKF